MAPGLAAAAGRGAGSGPLAREELGHKTSATVEEKLIRSWYDRSL